MRQWCFSVVSMTLFCCSQPSCVASKVDRRFFSPINYPILLPPPPSGRHKQEDALFDEMKSIHSAVDPHDVLLVMDSSIGQAAHAQASAFREVTGTKMHWWFLQVSNMCMFSLCFYFLTCFNQIICILEGLHLPHPRRSNAWTSFVLLLSTLVCCQPTELILSFFVS